MGPNPKLRRPRRHRLKITHEPQHQRLRESRNPIQGMFFNEYVILQNGTIVIWAHSHTGLLTKKCFFYTTWEYYTYVYHFITSSQGTQLTHQFWDFIQMDNDNPIEFDPVGIRVFT